MRSSSSIVISTIIAIILIIWLVVKWNNASMIKQKNKEIYAFADGVALLDNELRYLKLYSQMGKDSIQWLDEHLTPLKISIDSCTKSLKDNYRESESKRFDAYLNFLKKYRDVTYVYDDWVTTNENKNKSEAAIDIHEAYADYAERLQYASDEMDRSLRDLEFTDY